MRDIALITGASSGIGAAYAEVLAKNDYDLILCARRKDRLDTIKKELEEKHNIDVVIIAGDLTDNSFRESLYDKVNEKKITYLVNNAGFGDVSPFIKADWGKQEKMIELNILALTHLCSLFIPVLERSEKSNIVNISSTAAFQSLPSMSVYAASKSYVLSFTGALNAELRDKNINVCAICPGPTVSEFNLTAGANSSNVIDKSKLPTSLDVAQFAYKKSLKNRYFAIQGFKNQLLKVLVDFLPRSMVVNIGAKVMRRVQ